MFFNNRIGANTMKTNFWSSFAEKDFNGELHTQQCNILELIAKLPKGIESLFSKKGELPKFFVGLKLSEDENGFWELKSIILNQKEMINFFEKQIGSHQKFELSLLRSNLHEGNCQDYSFFVPYWTITEATKAAKEMDGSLNTLSKRREILWAELYDDWMVEVVKRYQIIIKIDNIVDSMMEAIADAEEAYLHDAEEFSEENDGEEPNWDGPTIYWGIDEDFFWRTGRSSWETGWCWDDTNCECPNRYSLNTLLSVSYEQLHQHIWQELNSI